MCISRNDIAIVILDPEHGPPVGLGWHDQNFNTIIRETWEIYVCQVRVNAMTWQFDYAALA